MSSKKHSNAAGQSSRGSASKGRMQLTSYLWKKIGMLRKNYGKVMEFIFWGSIRTLITNWTIKTIKIKLLGLNHTRGNFIFSIRFALCGWHDFFCYCYLNLSLHFFSTCVQYSFGPYGKLDIVTHKNQTFFTSISVAVAGGYSLFMNLFPNSDALSWTDLKIACLYIFCVYFFEWFLVIGTWRLKMCIELIFLLWIIITAHIQKWDWVHNFEVLLVTLL